MSYRKILVPLKAGKSNSHVLKTAFEIARAFGAHVAGVYVTPNPETVRTYLGPGVSARVVQEIMDAANEDAKRDAAAALESLEQAAKAADAPVRLPAHAGLGASFQLREGSTEDVIAKEALFSDLSVFEAPAHAKDAALHGALEATLLQSHTPILLVPHHAAHVIGAKIAIGWDGGAAAAHAVTAAIPLMKRAEGVEIITVDAGAADALPMDWLVDYLRLQGLHPHEHRVNPGSHDTASALIDAAKRVGAGLLVVGGYGHSRLRELVLGGVTRHVFANVAMPVFMAH